VLTYVEYGVSIEDLASLAIVTFRIPDLTDAKKRAQLPPSVHEPLSSSMLQGCAQAEEPLAIMQILTAVYLANASDGTPYKRLASLFPQSEITKYRKTLEILCTKAKTFSLGPEALTLQGLFLEREGKKEKAKDLYTEAVQRCHLKYNPKSRHPLQLPLIAPWNALGYFLKANKDPESQAQAKVYFNKGAIEADDPLSCYESAAFEERAEPNWLQYTSKAAASGHRQATVDLAEFYREASSKESPVLASTNMRKALNWLLEWKRGDPATLAREWLVAASNMGHKPSTLELADYYQSSGDQDKANECLRRLADPPRSANHAEVWPQLVEAAKKRLTGITI
jgi:tetratricopeptide (TPR) repeat protein